MTSNAELLGRLGEGDETAADTLVENNMGLVYSVVGRFVNCGYERDDLVQIGAIGLIKAVKKFDTSFDVQFSTYAVPMILGEIKRFLRDDGVIKISRSIKEAAIKGRRIEESLRKRLGRNPTVREISDESGIDEEMLLQAFEAAVPPESLQAAANADDDGLTLMGLVGGENEEEEIVDKLFIKESLKVLSERERKIITLRYFNGRTQSEIAAVMGVSQVQISRLEKKALLKMREILE